MVRSQDRSRAGEGSSGGVTSEWFQVQVESLSVGVGRFQARRIPWQTIQGGVREVATLKHGQRPCICRSSQQVSLSAEREKKAGYEQSSEI
jgi:hypothetical protein